MELKIGDVVKLKSDFNSHVYMTINGGSSEGADYFECVWFDKNEFRMASFHKNALKKIQD